MRRGRGKEKQKVFLAAWATEGWQTFDLVDSREREGSRSCFDFRLQKRPLLSLRSTQWWPLPQPGDSHPSQGYQTLPLSCLLATIAPEALVHSCHSLKVQRRTSGFASGSQCCAFNFPVLALFAEGTGNYDHLSIVPSKKFKRLF